MEEFPSLVVRKKPFLASLTSIYHLYFLSQIIGSSGKIKKEKTQWYKHEWKEDLQVYDYDSRKERKTLLNRIEDFSMLENCT